MLRVIPEWTAVVESATASAVTNLAVTIIANNLYEAVETVQKLKWPMDAVKITITLRN